MREGVSESNPWGKYDPSGIEILKANQAKLDDEPLTKKDSVKADKEEKSIELSDGLEKKAEEVKHTEIKEDMKREETKKKSNSMFGTFGL